MLGSLLAVWPQYSGAPRAVRPLGDVTLMDASSECYVKRPTEYKCSKSDIGELVSVAYGDTDDEMKKLASYALPRNPELVGMVADLSERLAAREKAVKVKVWDWSNATKDEQQRWLEELDDGRTTMLFARWPEYRHPKRVPVCWRATLRSRSRRCHRSTGTGGRRMCARSTKT